MYLIVLQKIFNFFLLCWFLSYSSPQNVCVCCAPNDNLTFSMPLVLLLLFLKSSRSQWVLVCQSDVLKFISHGRYFRSAAFWRRGAEGRSDWL